MAYNRAEAELYGAIGCFSTTLTPLHSYGEYIDVTTGVNGSFVLPAQCQAFLTTSLDFTWFIEQWDIVHASTESEPGTPLASFGSKKVYPAKVVGLSLPLIKNAFYNTNSMTLRWRDELIRYNSVEEYIDSYPDAYNGNYRPGFGEQIYSDLERPLKTVTVQMNNLGLPNTVYDPGFNTSNGLTGVLGRLMSVGIHVNKTLAQQYDDSKSKKKKKSLNKQTYQNPPEYPAYTPYQDSSGY